MKIKAILLYVMLFIAKMLYGNYAGSGGEFLSTYGINARAMAMGSAFSGLSDDISAVYYNPAGISQINVREISTFYSPIFPGEDISFFSFGYAQPIWGYGRAGINWLNLSSGGYMGRDAWGYETGISYSEHINTFLLSYGSPKYKNVLTGGVNIKLIFHSIEGLGRSYFGFGMDIGGFYKPYRFVSAGLMIQNLIPPKLSLSSSEEYYPMNIRFGVAGYLLKDTLKLTGDLLFIEPFARDIEKNGKMQIRYFLGTEYTLLKYFNLRAGFNYKEITAGIGVNYWGMRFDYSYGYNYLSLLSASQYLRVSLLVKIDELPFFAPHPPVIIPSVEHIVLGDRNKALAKNKKMDKQIKYRKIDLLSNNFYISKLFNIGVMVNSYYKFFNYKIFNRIKFVIPVDPTGFTYIYDNDIKSYIKDKKDIIISFYLPGTYINNFSNEGIDVKESIKFIRDGILHFYNKFKNNIKLYEIVYPEKSFKDGNLDVYNTIVLEILKFIKSKKMKNISLVAPDFNDYLDNDKIIEEKVINNFMGKFNNKISGISFNFTYENINNKDKLSELIRLQDYLRMKLSRIKNILKENNIYSEINYDLKVNQIKKKFYYALWLSDIFTMLLNTGFDKIYIPFKSQQMTINDIKLKNQIILDINKLYPDLKETNPDKYNKLILNFEKKLNLSNNKEEFDIADEKKKYVAYYLVKLFNSYLRENILINDENYYIVTKNPENNKLSLIFVNGNNKKRAINFEILNLLKGVYRLKKIVYSGNIYSDQVDSPKVVEEYEVNVINNLKINDSLLPASITVLDFELENK